MKWLTSNRLYLYNPKMSEINSTSIEKYRRIFIITDLSYLRTHDSKNCIWNIINKVNNKVKLRIIFIRPDKGTKKISKQAKHYIRTNFNIDELSSLFNINVQIESVKNFYIRTDSNSSNVFRITAIPNTTKSDYICCGINMFDDSVLLRISGTIGESIVDGIGMRYVVFTQGCPHHCEGCHNSQTWNYDGGTFVTINSLFNDIIQNPMLQGVTFSGGEPFMQPSAISHLIRKLEYHFTSINKKFDYTAYTGYTLEQLKSMCQTQTNKQGQIYCISEIPDLLYKCNYLIDGRFELKKRSLNCKFRGSTNQKMYERKRNSIEFKEIYPVQI